MAVTITLYQKSYVCVNRDELPALLLVFSLLTSVEVSL